MASGDEPTQKTSFHSESNFVVAFRLSMQTAHPFLEKEATATRIIAVPYPEIEDTDPSMRNATDPHHELRVEIVSTILSDYFTIQYFRPLHQTGLLTIKDRMCLSAAQGRIINLSL